MNQIIFSCPLLSGNRVIDEYQKDTQIDDNTHILLTTQFALPFGRSKSIEERANWFRYRLELFGKATKEAVNNQKFNTKAGDIIWLVFITKEDRDKFNLPKYELLNEKITLFWEEIDEKENAEDDYYRNIAIPSRIQSYIDCVDRNYKHKEYTLTLRVDSDDLINPLYLHLLMEASKEISQVSGFTRAYFYYPCGVTYNLQSKDVSTRIWPESSFMACLERTGGNLKTVWYKPHDSISRSEMVYPIVTNKPMWITLIGHGNMINHTGEYLSDLKDLNYPFINDKLEIRY